MRISIPVSEFDQNGITGPYGMTGGYLTPRTMRRARQFRRRVRVVGAVIVTAGLLAILIL